MKKVLPLVVVVAIAAGVWIYSSGQRPGAVNSGLQPQSGSGSKPSSGIGGTSQSPSSASVNGQSASSGSTGAAVSGSAGSGADLEDEEDGEYIDEEGKPASEIYKTADEALQALKKGAADYDDLILEQFSDLGESCVWCDDLYRSVKDLMLASPAESDERSYYAEVLAISGRVENVAVLVEEIKRLGDIEDADGYAEALELVVGNDKVVAYLAEQLNSENKLLEESTVAAITNQGSRLAAETLYKHTVAKGDSDGFYSSGIGLGEMVPDEDTLPYLQELMLKRDAYSHLAVKALLNSGLDGLRLVFEGLSNSKNPEGDKILLKDAVDHVNYEDDVVEYLKKTSSSSQEPLVKEFAQDILSDFKLDEGEEEEEG